MQNKNKLTETLGAPMANYGFDSTVYDNEDRLTAWSRVDDNKDQEWELSAAGDWDSFTEEAVEVERTHNDVHELTAVGQTSLTYDAKGNLTGDGTLTYTWDFDNRLKSTSEHYDYTYDALGRRVTKSVSITRHAAGSSGVSRRSAGGRSISRRGASTTVTTTTIFVPDGQQEVAEYTYVSTVGVPNLTKKYVYAAYIDEPVLMLNVSGETETEYYYHQNSLYSVGALTDQSGAVVERYSYLAYGAITFHDADGSVASPQSSTVANPYLFTGRRFDPETSLQYSRARYYHFNLGRWISRDPIGYGAGDTNLYRYCENSPLLSTDAYGNEPNGNLDNTVISPNLFNTCLAVCGISSDTKWGDTLTNPCFVHCVSGIKKKPGIGVPMRADGTTPSSADYQCCQEYIGRGIHNGVALCCEGRKISCLYDNYSRNKRFDNLDSTAFTITRMCIMAHERKHFDEYNCSTAKEDGCQYMTKSCFKPGHDYYTSEVRSFDAQLSCLYSNKSICGDNVKCKKDIDNESFRKHQRRVHEMHAPIDIPVPNYEITKCCS